jgi:hypothetical protein
MAATALTVRTLGDTPLTDPADVAPDTVNGNSFANSGQTFLRINNTAGSPGTITFHPADPTLGPENLAVSGEVITVPATTKQWVGRRDVATFGRVCTFTASASTMTVTVFEP